MAFLGVRDAARVRTWVDAELDREEPRHVLERSGRKFEASEQEREDCHAHRNTARGLREVHAARIVVELGRDLVAARQRMHDDRLPERRGRHRALRETHVARSDVGISVALGLCARHVDRIDAIDAQSP